MKFKYIGREKDWYKFMAQDMTVVKINEGAVMYVGGMKELWKLIRDEYIAERNRKEAKQKLKKGYEVDVNVNDQS